ncbi:uncharacterized protein OCT59_007954 [Rhizophagus irregularis]|nr:hypothetical protein OCT59_007954 [Rhizophagus irregularis]
MLNILMKEDLYLNENLNEFLKEWKYHASVLSSNDIIYFYGFTEDPNTSKYMIVMDYANKGERPEIIENTPQCYVNLMKKCWNEDPLKRPSTSKVESVIRNWIFRPYNDKVSEELKSNIMEFINAPIGKKLNEILESEDSQTSVKANEMLVSEDLNDNIIKDLGSLDENTSKKLNEILENENSQAIVEANELLVSEDLNDYIIKDLGSLDIKTDEN